jgi:phosphatidate cytidylyltransferase
LAGETGASESYRQTRAVKKTGPMLKQRILILLFLIPFFVFTLAAGGWAFILLITVMLGIGAWEYWRIFQTGGYNPSRALLIVGVVLLTLGRGLFGFQVSEALLAFLGLAAMARHVIGFERGESQPAVNFAITSAGLLYLGWLGPYLLSIRDLPDGQWWLLLVLPAVWFADGGAYFVGSRLGRTKMAPVTSPKKSWEGYAGGVIFSLLLTPAIAGLWHLRAVSLLPERGLLLGLTLSVLAPLGDLGESMLKRQFGVKDSGRLLPGHGGILDRMDTWIWSAAIGYYLIHFLWV